MTFYEELTQQLNGVVVSLEQCMYLAGVSSLRVAKEKAARHELPFPAFRVGGAKGLWHVKVKDIADYLETQHKKYSDVYEKVNT